ncbi:MAG: flexitail domain-containing putative surface protein, partial [Dehalococcoidia bacterium]
MLTISIRLFAAIALVLATISALPSAAQEVRDGGASTGQAPAPQAPAQPPVRTAQNVGTSCITYISPNVPVDVPTPPDTAGTVNVNITVPHNFVVTDVNVGPLNINHSFVQDLDATLFGPGGAAGVVLFNHIGGPTQAADIVDLVLDDGAAESVASQSAPFSGTYQPLESLSILNGVTSFGTWRLQITDSQILDTGVLLSWSLRLCGFYGKTIVVPSDLTDTEGNTENSYPFASGPSFQSIRYQQVYAAADLPHYRARITQIAFRPDGTFGAPFSTNGIDAEIRLAHTDSGVNTLNDAFALNLSRDIILVYDGPLHLSSANSGGPPRDFDIVIGLNQTFVYNGHDNLLLEVKVFNQTPLAFFDTSDVVADTTSRAYSFNVNSLTTDPGQTPFFATGLVTQFMVDGDTDLDACVDARELGSNPAQGGARDPKSFWDFFDTPDPMNHRDSIISAGDILRLASRFGTTGDSGIDPLSMPSSGYHT